MNSLLPQWKNKNTLLALSEVWNIDAPHTITNQVHQKQQHQFPRNIHTNYNLWIHSLEIGIRMPPFKLHSHFLSPHSLTFEINSKPWKTLSKSGFNILLTYLNFDYIFSKTKRINQFLLLFIQTKHIDLSRLKNIR